MNVRSPDVDNPYRAPEVFLEPVLDTVPRKKYFWLRSLIVLQLLVVIVGDGIAFWNVESIVGTGPILSIVGLLTAIVAMKARHYIAICVGFSGLLITMAVFLLIFFYGWSPQDAQEPVPRIGLAYLAGVCFAGGIALKQLTYWERRAAEDQSLAGGSAIATTFSSSSSTAGPSASSASSGQ